MTKIVYINQSHKFLHFAKLISQNAICSFAEKRESDAGLRRSSRTCSSRYRKPSGIDGMKDNTSSVTEVRHRTEDGKNN